MHLTNPPLDARGFPIPATFDDDGSGRGTPRRRIRNPLLCLVVVLAVVGVVAGSALYEPIRERVARAAGQMFLERGERAYWEDDLPGALEAFDRALAWDAELVPAYVRRGQARMESHDLAGSIEDFTHLIECDPSDPQGYLLRSHVYTWQQEHRKAIDDTTKAIELSSQSGPTATTADALNSRAYARALGNIELDEALADIERALEMREGNYAFLDTRGYIHYLRGDCTKALTDLELAVAGAEQEAVQNLALRGWGHPGGSRRWHRLINENLAVLYHHRGEIHGKLDNPKQAEADLRRGDELGYNPAGGVF
jgi:tetratricopeptide (TPR) repeat protein